MLGEKNEKGKSIILLFSMLSLLAVKIDLKKS